MDYTTGSIWRRWDFHFHTPSSFDYKFPTASDQQLVDGVRNENVSVIVVTDHHRLDADRIRSMRRLAGDSLVILPGIELRTNQGGQDCLHIIGIFPETADLDHLWTHLSGELSLTDTDIEKCGGPESKYVDFLKSIQTIHELGGLVSVHAGSKGNGIERIPNHPRFREVFKDDIVKKNQANLLEVGKPSDKGTYDNKVFPSVGRTLPLVLGSDCHDIRQYHAVAKSCWIKADATFEGLWQVLRMPEDRVCLGIEPDILVSRREDPTRFIESVTINKCSSANLDEEWFDGASVPLSPGMTAIIGNKGSGKSALAEVIGLLGNWNNKKDFTFLSTGRFRNKARKAEAFVGGMTWGDGKRSERNLMEDPSPNEQVRVRFIGQDFLEAVCNELVDVRDSQFQREIERVVYSHVSEPDRLGCESLEGIIRTRTTYIEGQINQLRTELHAINEDVVDLELRATGESRQELRNRVHDQARILKSHYRVRPSPVLDPDRTELAVSEYNKQNLKQIHDMRAKVESLGQKIESDSLRRREVARLAETCTQLRGGLRDLLRQYNEFIHGHKEEGESLGLDLTSLLKFSIDVAPIETKSTELSAEDGRLREDLDEQNEESLPSQKLHLLERIQRLQEQLDEPRKAYQEYLAKESGWREREKELFGDLDITGSLRALVGECLQWKLLPGRISELRTKRAEKVAQIHSSVDEIRGIYESLYQPVQDFASKHELLRDQAPITFSAAITQIEFVTRFGNMINHGRKGVFLGADEATQYVRDLVQNADFSTSEGALRFVDDLVRELATGERRGPGNSDKTIDIAAAAKINGQLRQDTNVAALYDFLYGIPYLEARYDLRFDRRSLGELSPGEKGSVLLAFYLLLDRSECPLVIDQPEGNLDNETVVNILIPCIREARKHRQIVLVTHNPNLAVVCDADEIIRASMVKDRSCAINYATGAIENPTMNKHIVDVLEGTQKAFRNRDSAYIKTP